MGALRSAAFRLKHDLGRAIVFGAPAAPEEETDALRARLSRDLLATRRTPDGRPLDAGKVYERWKAADGPALERPETRADLGALEADLARLRERLPALPTLGREELVALDRAARAVAARCAALHRIALAADQDV